MNLQEHYTKNVVPKLKKEFGYKNMMAVPKLLKVVLNIGISAKNKDTKAIETAKDTLQIITGQQPVECKARKSIANFKIRQGQVIGFMVTLRGKRMNDFIERLIKLTFARVRDFRGLNSSSFDPQGNWSIGFKEAIAFPEVMAGDADRHHGLEITVVTSANSKEEGFALLKELGFPFKKELKQ